MNFLCFSGGIIFLIIFLGEELSRLFNLLEKQIVVFSHGWIDMKLHWEPLLINIYLDWLLNLLILIKHLGLHLVTGFLLLQIWINFNEVSIIFISHSLLSYHLHLISVHCLIQLLHFFWLDCFLLSHCTFSFIQMRWVFFGQLQKFVHLISFIFNYIISRSNKE